MFMGNSLFASDCIDSVKKIVDVLNNQAIGIAIYEIESEFTKCYNSLDSNDKKLKYKMRNKLSEIRETKDVLEKMEKNLVSTGRNLNDVNKDDSSGLAIFASFMMSDAERKRLSVEYERTKKNMQYKLKELLLEMLKR